MYRHDMTEDDALSDLGKARADREPNQLQHDNNRYQERRCTAIEPSTLRQAGRWSMTP
jgi:hypothetical protein